MLSWDPPNNNGSEITGYTVRSQNGYEKQCGTTTCTLDGLTNDVEYTFTVFATNDVGDGPASPASAVARPDEKPDPPAAPELEFGDESLTVTWSNRTYTDRSAIETVNLEISPAPPGGAIQKTGLTGTQTTWEGLKNGVAYRVRVQAVNKAPEPSEWGDYSAEEIPAGVPDAPAAPNATRVDTALGGQVKVTWTAPFENGDAVKSYDLDVMRNGSVERTLSPVTGTSQTLEDLDTTATYTFRVSATNKAGTSAAGATSNASCPTARRTSPQHHARSSSRATPARRPA
ncbi:fibronectin type III domain-containing protein [Cellulosimicrobium sp. CUA-896]|uniref:fibronectin type III domain-containing protein n=1 Tax=Cellulosimicrobium sp. CUA-896 TaxID=1517881 RepID=UPI002101AAA4|nr:fibronectin type III domain-containing protein [Cellulosimicrobium sp. CUA-896]